MNTTKSQFDIMRELSEFALKYLDIKTLETGSPDDGDFKVVHIEQVKQALMEAFLLGRRVEREFVLNNKRFDKRNNFFSASKKSTRKLK